jgi:hypothetical protein
MAVKPRTLALPFLFLASVAIGGSPPVEVELLEFMGEFETSSGKPVDPTQFAKNEESSPQKDVKENAKTQKKETTIRKEKEDEKNLHR